MPSEDDPTLVRNQPAIRSGHRRRWLVPAGLLAAISVAFHLAALQLQVLIPVVGMVTITVLYLAMLTLAWTIRQVRARNLALAWIMIAMALVALGTLLVLILSEARSG